MTGFKKMLITAGLTAGLALSVFGLNTLADDNLLYEMKETQTITRGVTYDEITRVTKNGWLYMYVLTIDAEDENVDLDVIKSTEEYGYKESTLAISTENGVVAAVNGDYFGSGNPGSSMGQVLSDGNLEEARNYYNADANNYAGFFIDTDGVAFVDYLKTTVGFYNSSETIIELSGKNKYTDFSQPVYFDRQAITTTADLDKRNSNLTKIVVDTGAISYISQPGETVEVPENGYIIVMNNSTREAKIGYYSVGQAVSFVENGTFVFRPAKEMSQITFGISGGGEILRNGQTMAQGEIISPSSRNPRTCIGVSQDKSKIIILCIDGRVKGIGATTYECSQIMKELGAYDAIQLDGGGSTTMVIKPQGEESLQVVNTPSDGAQRSVANAVGISSVGEYIGLGYIEVETSANGNILVNGLNYNLSYQAYDNLYNKMSLSSDSITFSVEGVEGDFDGLSFTPSSEGIGKLIAATTLSDGTEIRGEADIVVLSEISYLSLSPSTQNIEVGQSTAVTAVEYNKDGFGGRTVESSLLTYDVSDASKGYVTDDGYFVATGEGEVKITAYMGDISGSTSVYVGKTTETLNNFETPPTVQFLKFPENGSFTGSAGIQYGIGISGNTSVRLSYSFTANTSSVQCAYASFTDRLPVSGSPSKLGLYVRGENNGVIVKINIRDANETSYNISLTDSLDFSGWQYLSGSVPTGVVYPIQVMSVYAAVLSTSDTAPSGTIYFDNLSADIGSYSLTLEPDDYMDISKAAEGTSNLYIVSEGVNASALSLDGLATSWYSNYTTAGNDSISIVNLSTANGTLLKSNDTQIRYFADYVNRLASDNIVIMVKSDMYATGSGKFSDSREAEIVHKVLKEEFLNGKNIIVVSNGGSVSSVNIKDGVRYVNIAETSSSAPIMTIKYDSENMYYGF
ncbi:MAG: phosphodiester glycosidase family protein [Clostridiales bacterium]|nr:phosphodiester glycosidase family protein [Clostridiales bacterium]